MNLKRTKHYDSLLLDNLKDCSPSQIPQILQKVDDYLYDLQVKRERQAESELFYSAIFNDRPFATLTFLRFEVPPVLLIEMRPTNTSILVNLGNRLGHSYDYIAVRTPSQDLINHSRILQVYMVATTASHCFWVRTGDRVFVNSYGMLQRL